MSAIKTYQEIPMYSTLIKNSWGLGIGDWGLGIGD